ncbi:MAG: hypothetical protein HGB00_08390 [Chlorobiaceae bacterium]|nr:hypothetical protein [Chlorobiaceae bacterium]
MTFSSDTDLQNILPGIFSYGITSYAQYHATAAAELIRDIRRYWIPRQSTVLFKDFNKDKLDSNQWVRASCLRVLAYHVLPRLVLEVAPTDTTPDFKTLINTYKANYREELDNVITDGVFYNTGNGLVWIESISIAESQRLIR